MNNNMETNYNTQTPVDSGFPQQQQQQQQQQQPQQQYVDSMALRAEREGMVAQGVTLRNEHETFVTDRMNLEQKARLLKMQEKQKKKEGKKLSKQEKELGKKEMKALKMGAERKALAGEPLTSEEQKILSHISGGHGGDDITHDKNKKKADKRTKQIQKELMGIDFNDDGETTISS